MNKNKILEIVLKIVSVVLLLLASQKLKYVQYEIIRFSLFVIFILLGYLYYKKKSEIISILFILIAFLFQPFVKISLGKTIWQIVDYVLAIGVLFLIVFELISKFYKINQNKTKK